MTDSQLLKRDATPVSSKFRAFSVRKTTWNTWIIIAWSKKQPAAPVNCVEYDTFQEAIFAAHDGWM